MRISLADRPAVLTFGEGADAFSLIMKRMTGEDRLAIVDVSFSQSYAEMQRACGRLVADWQNVCNEDGTPIPFKVQAKDKTWTDNFTQMMGAIPFGMQMRVLAGIMGFAGVPTEGIDQVIRNIDGGDGNASDPIGAPDANTGTGASGG